MIDRSGFSLLSGTFSLAQTAIASGAYSGGRDLVLSYSCVPEATTLLLALAGFTPMLMQRRSRRC